MYQNRVGIYKRNDVLTADPTTLVVICYNSAISHLKLAKNRITEGDYETKAESVNKAIAIISELMAALNFERGGEISRNLDALYRYSIGRITHFGVNRDMSAADEVIGILEELRDAWKEISGPKIKEGAIQQPQPHNGVGFRPLSVA